MSSFSVLEGRTNTIATVILVLLEASKKSEPKLIKHNDLCMLINIYGCLTFVWSVRLQVT